MVKTYFIIYKKRKRCAWGLNILKIKNILVYSVIFSYTMGLDESKGGYLRDER